MDKKEENNTLEIMVSDGTGEARLVYPYQPVIMEGYRMLPDTYNSPLHGADRGDMLRVCNSTYEGENSLLLHRDWFVMNDDHYGRVKNMRARHREIA